MNSVSLRNVPFCVLPKGLPDTLLRRRVVINEANVSEFSAAPLMMSGADNAASTSADAAAAAPSTVGAAIVYRNASQKPPLPSATASAPTKKPKRLSGFIKSSSLPRMTKTSGMLQITSASSTNQEPILAQCTNTNPFAENRFPVIYSHLNLSFHSYNYLLQRCYYF